MFRIPDTARLSNPRRAGRVAVASCFAVTALVAGCGGGDKVKPFQPTQVIAFGDENSAFDDTTASSSSAMVTYNGPGGPATIQGSRYTVNVLSDAGYLCKGAEPTISGLATCDNNSTLFSTTEDYPTNTSFFKPTSSAFQYRVSSGIPIVHEVVTGTITEAISTTPSPVYQTVDHVYHCSMDFGSYFGNWVQVLIHGLGGGGLSIGAAGGGCAQDSGNGKSYAAWGADVDAVAAQVAAHRSELHDGVLVPILAGQNDIVNAFNEVLRPGSTLTEEDAKIRMRERGARLGQIINDIITTGARVVYLTVPDMGKSPLAVDAGKSALATALTDAFNEGYRDLGGLTYTTATNGHKIVKVDGFNLIAGMAASYPAKAACYDDPTKVKTSDGRDLLTALPGINALTPSLKAKALLLNCTSNNLVVVSGDYNATPPTKEVRADFGAYLWADSTHMTPIGHSSLGIQAASRIRSQL
ncbi:MAG: hypothetical protein EOP38_17330 [Rubrivivax sp.]|nr:MAG: hypothetical protein EOP38_17330 [Rubrivivax sp.]